MPRTFRCFSPNDEGAYSLVKRHAYVISEHGDSEVLVWSQATIAGLSLPWHPERTPSLTPVLATHQRLMKRLGWLHAQSAEREILALSCKSVFVVGGMAIGLLLLLGARLANVAHRPS